MAATQPSDDGPRPPLDGRGSVDDARPVGADRDRREAVARIAGGRKDDLREQLPGPAAVM